MIKWWQGNTVSVHMGPGLPSGFGLGTGWGSLLKEQLRSGYKQQSGATQVKGGLRGT